MISITDVPNLHKQDVLKQLDTCLNGGDEGDGESQGDDGDDDDSTLFFKTHTFDDGTVRKTIATSTTAQVGKE